MAFAGQTSNRISDERLHSRIAAFRVSLADAGVAAAILYSAPKKLAGSTQTCGNVHYFAGWSPSGAHSIFVLPAVGRPKVIATGPNEARVFAQRIGEFADIHLAPLPSQMAHAVSAALAEANIGAGASIGIAGASDMPASLHANLARRYGNLVPLDKVAHAPRLARHAEEVALHRRAATIADRMIQRAMDLAVVSGMTPVALMAEVECAGRRLGADMAGLWLATGPAPSFTCFELFELAPTISPTDRIQLGATLSVEGHFAQELRMGVRGKPSNRLRDWATRLLDIQDAALAELVPGRPVHALVDTLEALIDKHCPFTRESDPFRFQSCHGLGLDYSEPALSGALSPARDRSADHARPLVAENMVFEIHPNFTVPGIGHVCAGDVALVTAHGGEWLTQYPRGLVLLD